MAMKAYKSYKNVDLPWLKRVPEHWEIASLARVAKEQKIKKPKGEHFQVLSLSYGKIIKKKDINFGLVPKDYDNYQLLHPGNIVLRFTDLQNDHKSLRTGLVTQQGIITSAYVCIDPIENPAYIHYLLHHYDTIKLFYGMGNGIRQSIGYKDISDMRIPVPPKEEQDQIVRYLDWQNSRLNKLINAKKKEIALLEELLASIISNCTSKVQLWHTKPFTKIAKICSNVVSSDCYKQSPQISPANIEKNTGCLISYGTVEESGIIGVNNLFFKGQILYSKIRPMLNKVTLAPVDGLCSTDIYPIETSLHAPYLIYFMLSGNFLSQIKTSDNRVKMPRLNKEELSSISVDFPDYDQQIKIARYLDIVRAKIKNSISSINNQIITLQEYRTRLVADVVTGQIDVRNIAIPNYETVPETIDQPETAEESAISAEDQ